MLARLQASPLIPAPLRELYSPLAGSVIMTRAALDELARLYGSKQVVERLNEVAPAFFVRHQHLLTEHIIMSLARLTDAPRSGRRGSQENLTYLRLLHGLTDEHHGLRRDLQGRSAKIHRAAEPIRRYRHQVIGHSSLLHCLSQTTDLGMHVTIKSLEELLTELSAFLSAFDCYFTGVETAYRFDGRYGEDILSVIETADR